MCRTYVADHKTHNVSIQYASKKIKCCFSVSEESISTFSNKRLKMSPQKNTWSLHFKEMLKPLSPKQQLRILKFTFVLRQKCTPTSYCLVCPILCTREFPASAYVLARKKPSRLDTAKNSTHTHTRTYAHTHARTPYALKNALWKWKNVANAISQGHSYPPQGQSEK